MHHSQLGRIGQAAVEGDYVFAERHIMSDRYEQEALCERGCGINKVYMFGPVRLFQ
jgi:hypothetical protein